MTAIASKRPKTRNRGRSAESENRMFGAASLRGKVRSLAATEFVPNTVGGGSMIESFPVGERIVFARLLLRSRGVTIKKLARCASSKHGPKTTGPRWRFLKLRLWGHRNPKRKRGNK